MAAPPSTAGADAGFDPDARLVNISCFDFLLIELIPLAERMARAYEASLDRPVPAASSSTASKRSSRGPPPPVSQQGSTTTTAGGVMTTTTATTGSGVAAPAITVTSATAPPGGGAGAIGTTSTAHSVSATPTLIAADGLPSTHIFADSVYVRLERLGFRVGEGLSERFSRDRPRFNSAGLLNGSAGAGGAGAGGGAGGGVVVASVGNVNDHQLDVIKFLCKDIWTVVWRKQVDNLKTNHRGVFVLTDAKFRPLMRMSMASGAEAVHRAQSHLFFPCGIIRGVLASLGIKATVQAETTELPSAVFQIKTLQAKS